MSTFVLPKCIFETTDEQSVGYVILNIPYVAQNWYSSSGHLNGGEKNATQSSK